MPRFGCRDAESSVRGLEPFSSSCHARTRELRLGGSFGFSSSYDLRAGCDSAWNGRRIKCATTRVVA